MYHDNRNPNPRRRALWIHGPLGPLVTLLHFRYLIPILLVFGSALGVVYAKHYTRVLNAQSQSLRQQQSLLQTEWRQLLVEHTSWMAKDHIERLAKTQLGMQYPEKTEMIILEKTNKTNLPPKR